MQSLLDYAFFSDLYFFLALVLVSSHVALCRYPPSRLNLAMPATEWLGEEPAKETEPAQETPLALAKFPDAVAANPNFPSTERVQWMEAELQEG